MPKNIFRVVVFNIYISKNINFHAKLENGLEVSITMHFLDLIKKF